MNTPTPTEMPEDSTPTPVVEEGAKVETSTGTVVATDADGKVVAFNTVDKTATEIKFPSTVKINGATYKVAKIEDNAFAGSKKLTTVTIPAAVTEIGKAAFKNCTKLTSITIPKNITTFGTGCKKLKKWPSKQQP